MTETGEHLSVIAPCQCRAARGLLDWTQDHLARAAGVSRSTVRDFESGRHSLQRANARLLAAAFHAAGVQLIGSPRAGPGVRLIRQASG